MCYTNAVALIVAGHLIVQPPDREEYLRGCVEVITLARATEGCLDFSLSADLVDPGRINIFERWESHAAVEAFRDDGPSDDQTATIVGAEVSEYDISSFNRL